MPANKTMSADEFFIAVVSVLKIEGVESIKISDAVDKAFEGIYRQLRGAVGADVTLSFRVRTHPLHGDSQIVRELIDAGSKNNIVDVSNPTFTSMKPKLSSEEADYFLNQIPVDREWFQSVVNMEFNSLTRGDNSRNAA